MLDVPLFKAYLFPAGVYDATINAVEVVENSYYEKDPDNNVKNQLKIELVVDHKDEKFPGRVYKKLAFIPVSLSSKSKLFKYHEALTGKKLTLQDMEAISESKSGAMVFKFDEHAIVGRKVKIVLEEGTNQMGVPISKIASIVPDKMKIVESAKA